MGLFKVSNDPEFEAKFWDVIGLYLDPPERSLELCCDEKPQCQTLERTQSCLRLGIGHIRTRTHDYIPHGTITLFGALSYLDGKPICCTENEHTHLEWLRFLQQIDRQTPKDLEIHLIADNYCTHKRKTVRRWIERRLGQQVECSDGSLGADGSPWGWVEQDACKNSQACARALIPGSERSASARRSSVPTGYRY